MAQQLFCTRDIHSSVRAIVPCRLDERDVGILELWPLYSCARQDRHCRDLLRLFLGCRDGIVERFFVAELLLPWLLVFAASVLSGICVGRFDRLASQTFPASLGEQVEAGIALVDHKLDDEEEPPSSVEYLVAVEFVDRD